MLLIEWTPSDDGHEQLGEATVTNGARLIQSHAMDEVRLEEESAARKAYAAMCVQATART